MNENKNSKKYNLTEIDLINPKNSHDFQIIFTGNDKKVLEIGTATGYISKILKEKNCHISGIEINSDWAKESRKYVDKMIVGDVEKLDLKKEFYNEKFDVILLGDVLEHLENPSYVLKKLRPLTKPDGYLVCSIPNISHISVRLKLLNGNLLNEETGILDKTHKNFYTLDNILLMLDESDLQMIKLQRIKEDFFLHHRTDFISSSFHDDLIEAIKKDPESETFQFVFMAKQKSITNSSNRKFLIQNFSKNHVSEYLKFLIDEYIRKILYFEKVVAEKDEYFEKVVAEKDEYFEKVVAEKDEYFEKTLFKKDAMINQIKQNKILRILKKWDEIRGK